MRPNLSNILKALGVPTGGTVGQVLKKTGSGDTDYGWANESGGGGREVPTGGSQGQVLTKTGSGDTDYGWDNIPTPTVTLPDLVVSYNITTEIPTSSVTTIWTYVYINGTRGSYTRIDNFLETYYNTHAIIRMNLNVGGNTIRNITPTIYRIGTRNFYLTYSYMDPYEENFYFNTYLIENGGGTKLVDHKKVN